MIRQTLGGGRGGFDLLESWTKIRFVRGGSRGDDGYGDVVLILVNAVLMDGRQSQGGMGDDVDADKYPFGFDLLPVGLDGKFGSVVRWCSCRSRNHGRTSESWWLGILQRTFGLESAE